MSLWQIVLAILNRNKERERAELRKSAFREVLRQQQEDEANRL